MQSYFSIITDVLAEYTKPEQWIPIKSDVGERYRSVLDGSVLSVSNALIGFIYNGDKAPVQELTVNIFANSKYFVFVDRNTNKVRIKTSVGSTGIMTSKVLPTLVPEDEYFHLMLSSDEYQISYEEQKILLKFIELAKWVHRKNNR